MSRITRPHRLLKVTSATLFNAGLKSIYLLAKQYLTKVKTIIHSALKNIPPRTLWHNNAIISLFFPFPASGPKKTPLRGTANPTMDERILQRN